MHGNLPAQAQRAIFPAAQSCREITITPESGTVLPIAAQSCRDEDSQWFQKLCGALWPDKAPAALYYLLDETVPERTCRAYASGEREPPGTVILRLIASADGGRMLAYHMRKSNAPWWQRYQFALSALPAVEQLRQLSLPLK